MVLFKQPFHYINKWETTPFLKSSTKSNIPLPTSGPFRDINKPFPNRYKEQKSRMNLCGIKVKYYLVEEAGLSFMPPATTGTSSRAIDRNTLDQAISNTCIRDGFKIRRSNSQKDSCKFLQVFTRYCFYKTP